jgi:hypothetical protein
MPTSLPARPSPAVATRAYSPFTALKRKLIRRELHRASARTRPWATASCCGPGEVDRTRHSQSSRSHDSRLYRMDGEARHLIGAAKRMLRAIGLIS